MTRLDELFADLPPHITVDQLAQVLGLAKVTTYRWLADGKVPAYRVAGQWVILRDEIRDFLAAHRTGPPEERDSGSQ